MLCEPVGPSAGLGERRAYVEEWLCAPLNLAEIRRVG